MKAAIYIRVSTARQAQDGDSLAAQRSALQDYAKARGYAVVDTYVDDGISGQKLEERDELMRMLGDCEAGKVDLILFTKLDRFFRSTRHYANVQAQLDQWKVQWIAIWENYNTTTPQGQLMVTQLMAFAQFEAQNAGARIRQVLDYKAQRGEVISGTVPFGYRIESKRLVVDEEQAGLVRKAFDTYIEKGSIWASLKALDGTGLPTTCTGLRKLLMNRKYIGEFRENGSFCPGIVRREVYEEAQRMLSMNVKSKTVYPYIFTGLVKCPHCGIRMSGCHTRQYLYYRCEKRKVRCQGKQVSERKLEAWLLENVMPLFQKLELEVREMDEKREDADALSRKVEQKIARLKDLYINGLIDLEEYKADKAKFEKEIEAIRKQADPPKKVDLSEVKSRLSDLGGYYAALGPEDKRSFWRSVIQEIVPDVDGFLVKFVGE